MDGAQTKCGVVNLNPFYTHIHSHLHTKLFLVTAPPLGNTKNSFSYVMTSAQREQKTKPKQRSQPAVASLLVTHTRSLIHTGQFLALFQCPS